MNGKRDEIAPVGAATAVAGVVVTAVGVGTTDVKGVAAIGVATGTGGGTIGAGTAATGGGTARDGRSVKSRMPDSKTLMLPP